MSACAIMAKFEYVGKEGVSTENPIIVIFQMQPRANRVGFAIARDTCDIT